MKIVLTGATGHVGRALVQALADHEIVAVSRGGEAVGASRGLAADLSDDASVASIASELGPDTTLVHLAAVHPAATAATTPADRRALVHTNVLGTMRVLDAARSAGGVKAVVYASTFEVYGEPRDALIDESHRTYPRTDYGATKLSGEHHVAAFAYEEGGVRTVCLRMPAVYGPGEKTPRALPNFLERVAAGEAPVVYGDGGDLRDQLHVRDAALAIERALEAGDGVYNVSDGQSHSVLEIAQLAINLAELDCEPELRERDKERRDFHMDISRAQSELGFKPRVSLEDGMREQLAWLRKRAQG